jgi:glutamine amidotransferase
MSSRMPTSVGFSLERLARRGGAEGPHRDGWGVGYYSGPDALLLREPGAASESGLAHHIEQHGPPSELVISHIRLATRGEPALQNTQPFVRELGGRSHLFAHNGELDGLTGAERTVGRRFRPIGDTDSEAAFCKLLDDLMPLWDAVVEEPPPMEQRFELVTGFAARLRKQGIANFLYADSDTLFAHSDHRTPPGSQEVLPGLHVLERGCTEEVPDMSDSGVTLKTVQQALTLAASAPLTDEKWHPLAKGEVLAIRGGEIVGRRLG